MPYEVLMPQLGMAQDSAIIVSWLKAPGDAVVADDPLIEVETDKATMEIPAGRDGFLTQIRAAVGVEVPVGDVIAIISESADDFVTMPAAGEAHATPAMLSEPASNTSVSAKTATAAWQPPVQNDTSTASVTVSAKPVRPAKKMGVAERVLASPKARLAVADRGLDLNALVRQGAEQPIHFCDLDQFSTSSGSGLSVLSAQAEGETFAGLLTQQADPIATRRRVLSAFACGALRMAAGWSDRPIMVESSNLGDIREYLKNPDLTGVSAGRATGDVDLFEVDLTLFDLTETRLKEYRPAMGHMIQVSVATDTHGGFSLCLSFCSDVLSVTVAADFLNNFAMRIEDPIRHIL